ncbi:MAG: flavodoxin [Candidatus Gastranaerophilales bacterium]|nr:flavodoxin [Candidatus Gastranaerophilales bacterium]
MKKIIFIILGILIVSAGVVFAFNNNTKVNANTPANKNILVAYFSATGTTKRVAENLAKATGGDLYEIKPTKAYTSADLNWQDDNSRSSVEMNDSKSRPEIITGDLSVENYDTIYLGFPIWWGTAPKVVHTFLEKYDFSGKKIIIFATSGSSGLGNTANDLKSGVSEQTTIIEGNVLNSNPSVEDLKQWVKKF